MLQHALWLLLFVESHNATPCFGYLRKPILHSSHKQSRSARTCSTDSDHARRQGARCRGTGSHGDAYFKGRTKNYGKSISIIETKNKESYTNTILKKTLIRHDKKYKNYSFLERGSDERQFNAPGIDLPVATLMRDKFASFKQYHTSEDNIKLIKKSEITNSYIFILKLIENLENDILENL